MSAPQTDDHPRIGTVLSNGCTVIAARQHDRDRWVVFALTESDSGDPYATWIEHEGETFWGHYFDDIVEAAHDFAERP